MSTQTEEQTLTEENPVIELEKSPVGYDEGDHDRFAHYVRKSDLDKAMFDGVAIQALCGKKWVPTKDYKKFPVCPDCKKIWESLPNNSKDS